MGRLGNQSNCRSTNSEWSRGRLLAVSVEVVEVVEVVSAAVSGAGGAEGWVEEVEVPGTGAAWPASPPPPEPPVRAPAQASAPPAAGWPSCFLQRGQVACSSSQGTMQGSW